jgi:DNA-binding transcriptional MerR regulator
VSIKHMQIGEVAERTGLSLRTIRYYEEVGLVEPSARTQGRFRLYSEADVARLDLVKRMKPLDFSLEEMRDVLSVLDALEHGADAEADRAELLDRLAMYRTAAEERCRALRDQLETAEAFATSLRRELSRQRRLAARSPR